MLLPGLLACSCGLLSILARALDPARTAQQQQPGLSPATRVPVLQMLELRQLLKCVPDAWTAGGQRVLMLL
jgi:hypothetical protein